MYSKPFPNRWIQWKKKFALLHLCSWFSEFFHVLRIYSLNVLFFFWLFTPRNFVLHRLKKISKEHVLMILSIVIFKRKFHGEKKKKMGRKRVIIYHFSDMTSTKLQKLLPYFSCFQLKKKLFFFYHFCWSIYFPPISR